MPRRFDIIAASHGAAGMALITIFGSAGVITLFDLLTRQALATAFLAIATSYALGMLFFGFRTRSHRD